MSWNTTIITGTVWEREFAFTIATVPVDLTGYTATARIGGITLSTGSGIVIDGPAGTVTVTASAIDTAGLHDGVVPFELDVISGGGVPLPRVKAMVTVE